MERSPYLLYTDALLHTALHTLVYLLGSLLIVQINVTIPAQTIYPNLLLASPAVRGQISIQ